MAPEDLAVTPRRSSKMDGKETPPPAKPPFSKVGSRASSIQGTRESTPNKCGAPKGKNRGPCTNNASNALGTCNIPSHIQWGESRPAEGEIREIPEESSELEHDVRCLATASNKQRCPFPRDADRLTCGRAEHRDQEAGLEATLLAELVSGNNIATPALPDMLTQILPAAEATEASTRASTPYNLLERPNGPINDYSNLNNPDGSMLGNDDIKMDIAEVKQDLRAVTTLLEKSLHESRNTIQHLDDLKVRYASHNQQIESLERGPSPQQLHHTVQQSQDMIKMMENVKKQFAESLHHTDPRTLVELKDLTTRVDALADLTKLSAKFDALNEQLAPLKTGAIEVWKDFGVKLDELFSMYSQLRIDTIQALAADGAVVEELAVELKTHMTSSPAHAEERIGGSLKSLAESYQSFKNATMQSNNTRDKRLKLVKEKVVEYRDNVDKLGGRVSELEEAVTAKFVSEAEPKTLKSSVESQGRRLETLAQQHSQDRDEFQARLEAIEQQFAATPIADNSMAQRPEPSTSRGTSVSREEQQEEQINTIEKLLQKLQ